MAKAFRRNSRKPRHRLKLLVNFFSGCLAFVAELARHNYAAFLEGVDVINEQRNEQLKVR
jgi:hypothetical protein